MRDRIRNIDILGRYGGDEFLVILPESDSQKALAALSRIKNEMSQMSLGVKSLQQKEIIELKFSAGVASFPYNGQSINDLIALADASLYRAKLSGRNKIITERRRCLRVNPVQDLKVEILNPKDINQVNEVNVKNISQRGMLVVFDRDMKDEEFLCRIKFPGDGEKSSFLCKVVNKRSVPGQDGVLCYAGVCFAEIPEEDETRLKEIVDQVLEKNKI